jgi:branched-chain amino acid transport system substrate-binding protein
MRFGKLLAVAAACVLALSAAPAMAAGTIKVGAILAVTGPLSFLGAPEAKTLEMLVEDINARGGWGGSKVELVIKDSGGSPEKAIDFARQLIEQEKVFAIIGPSTSGETMAIKNIAEEGKTILLSCAAAEMIVNPVAKYVFKTPQKDSFAADRIFEQMKKMGITRVGVLSSNSVFGRAGKEWLERLAPRHGVRIVASRVYDMAATDLTSEVAKLKAAKVQAIVNWSVEPAQAVVIKNARRMGLNVPIFQSHGFGNINYVKAAGPAAEGVIFPAGRLLVADALPDKDPQKALLLSYKHAYEAKYKEDASSFGGFAYDAMLILERGVREGGGDREKVRSAIENIKGLIGTAGIFTMSPTDHNGLDRNAFEMLTVKDGKFVVFKK